jgi:arginine exporter protein ArgO
VAGTFIGMAGSRTNTARTAAVFLLGALMTSLVLAWALASVVASVHPALASPYTPTIIAFLIGANASRLRKYAEQISSRIDEKLGVSK